MAKNKNNNRGRPRLYEEKVLPRLEEIGTWIKSGATQCEVAAALGVAASTFGNYCREQKELRNIVDVGKMSGVPEVKMALYKRAVGYEYEERKTYIKRDNETGKETKYTEITIKHIAPDVSAIGMYLRNCGENWMDKDKFTVEMKEEEMKLRKMLVEAQSF